MRRILTIVFILICTISMGQDLRYSQYFNNSLTVNPALTGANIDYLRTTISYRRQSFGPAVAFTTKGVMLDKKVGRVGLGFMINSNGAGDASVKTLNLCGSVSYSLKFGYKGSNTISTGAQFGAISRSINPAKLTFDSQYQQDIGYDPNISSGEVFETQNTIKPVVNVGLFWKTNPVKKHDSFLPFLGYSVANINRPDISFFGTSSKTDIRHYLTAGSEIRITDQATIKPGAYYVLQGPFSETGFGVIGSLSTSEDHEIQGGLYSRAGKALMIYAGYQIDRFLVGMSYDVSAGKINETGKGNNAFELSLTFRPKAKTKPEAKEPAPDKKTETQKKKPGESGVEPVKKHNTSTLPGPSKGNNTPAPSTTDRTPKSTTQKTDLNIAPKPEAKATIVPAYVKPYQLIENGVSLAPVITTIRPKMIIKPDNSDETPLRNNEVITTAMPNAAAPISVRKEELVPAEITTDRKAIMVIKPDVEAPVLKHSEMAITPVESIPSKTIKNESIFPEISTAYKSLTIVAKEDPSYNNEKTIVSSMKPLDELHLITNELVPALQPDKAAASFIIIAEDKSDISEEKETAITEHVDTTVSRDIKQPSKIIAPDSDGDGFNDYEDPCPFIKGPASTKGCPDTDNDGIMDMMDFCPLESGPKSHGGCPVQELHGPGDQRIIRSFDHILFNSGSTSLSIDNTFDIVERAIEILYANKNSYVLISGHTDSEGDGASNMVLSQQRADIVKSYLLNQGIQNDRIKTIPYGENMPIRENSDEAKRKFNRRVEITILKKD